MRLQISALGFLGALSSTASAGELTLGEMDTAVPIENQDLLLHPLFDSSSIGLSEKFELSSCIACAIEVANAEIMYNLMQKEDRAFSVGGEADFVYVGGAEINAKIHYSTLAGRNWLSVSAGTGVSTSDGVVETSGSPLTISYLILKGDRAWKISTEANPYSIYQAGSPEGALNVEWHRAWDVFRLGVGLQLLAGDLDIPVLHFIEDAVNTKALPVAPLPVLSMAWRI